MDCSKVQVLAGCSGVPLWSIHATHTQNRDIVSKHFDSFFQQKTKIKKNNELLLNSTYQDQRHVCSLWYSQWVYHQNQNLGSKSKIHIQIPTKPSLIFLAFTQRSCKEEEVRNVIFFENWKNRINIHKCEKDFGVKKENPEMLGS